jgi:hypothetical protein
MIYSLKPQDTVVIDNSDRVTEVGSAVIGDELIKCFVNQFNLYHSQNAHQ